MIRKESHPANLIRIAIFFKNLIPVSFSGIGSHDVLLVYIFDHINLSAELAISYSTIYFVIFYLFTGLLGFIAFMYKPIKLDLAINYYLETD